jgi:hypothetical protein
MLKAVTLHFGQLTAFLSRRPCASKGQRSKVALQKAVMTPVVNQRLLSLVSHKTCFGILASVAFDRDCIESLQRGIQKYLVKALRD